jgi:hypothetical protein
MPAARRHAARARARHLRVVTATAAGQATTVDRGARQILLNGLQWALLLRRHFPDAYAEHVAQRTTKPLQLYGVANYFLTLAHLHCISLHTDHLRITPSDPARALQSQQLIGESRAQYELVGELERWRHTPLPRIYGMVKALSVLHRRGIYQHGRYDYNRPEPLKSNALAVALWRLVSSSSWAVMPERDARVEAGYFESELLVEALAREARPLTPKQARAVPWAAVCRRLDRAQPEGVRDLGAVLAYVCGQTGNPYADRAQYELGPEGGADFDLNWRRPIEHFRAERARQRAAARLQSRYRAIDRAVVADPALLGRLCGHVRAIAAELAGTGDASPYPAMEPSALIDLLADSPDDSEETP